MDHPTPLAIINAISAEVAAMNADRIAEGFDPLPVETTRRLREAVWRACAEHDRATNKRFAA